MKPRSIDGSSREVGVSSKGRGPLRLRSAIGGGVLLLWGVLLALHAHREIFRPELTRLAEATLSLAPTSHFYAVEMGGRPLGMASSRWDTLPDGFLLEDHLELDLLALGQAGTAIARTRVELSRTLGLQAFTFSLQSGGEQFTAEGAVEGDTLLRVEVASGAAGRSSRREPEQLTFRLSEPPLLAAALPLRLAKGGLLAEGKSYAFRVFDPSTVSNRQIEVRVVSRDSLLLPDSAVFDPGARRWGPGEPRWQEVWQIEERFGGVTVESWIDGEGRVVRASSPMGFRLERAPYELIRQARSEARRSAEPPLDLVWSTAIQAGIDLGRVEDHAELRFLLSGVNLEGFHLDGGRQELRGDTLIVRRESLDTLRPGYELPYPRMDLRADLSAEPLIQSQDPGLQREARRLAGMERSSRGDPLAVALRLNEGVYRMLRKERTFSLPSALRVLETRAGDCNEHTVLFVALARAVGLPARAAVGLVYLEGAFFYHAWPEVWLGDWVALDPTFGQAPANAAHLRFMTGSLAQQVELARLMGALRIRVLDPASDSSLRGGN